MLPRNLILLVKPPFGAALNQDHGCDIGAIRVKRMRIMF